MSLAFIIKRYQCVCLLNIFNVKHLSRSEFQPYWLFIFNFDALLCTMFCTWEKKMTISYRLRILTFFYDKFFLFLNSFKRKKEIPEIHNISVILSSHNCFTNHAAWPPPIILHYSKIQNNIPVWQLTSGTTGLVSRSLHCWRQSR